MNPGATDLKQKSSKPSIFFSRTGLNGGLSTRKCIPILTNFLHSSIIIRGGRGCHFAAAIDEQLGEKCLCQSTTNYSSINLPVDPYLPSAHMRMTWICPLRKLIGTVS